MVLCAPFNKCSKGGFSLNPGQTTRNARRSTARPSIPVISTPENGIFKVLPVKPIEPNFNSQDSKKSSEVSKKRSTGKEESKNVLSGENNTLGILDRSSEGSKKHSTASKKSNVTDYDISGQESIVEPKTTGRETIGILVGSNKSPDVKQGKRRSVIVPPIPVDTKDLQYKVYNKDESSIELIKSAIKINDFLRNLIYDERLSAIVDAMSPQEYPAGSLIIREGESGSHLYVSAYGQFEVLKAGQVVKTFGAGEAFGELAILYKAKRFASIRCITDAKIWMLERRVFQKIMVYSGQREQEDNIRFLESVALLRGMAPEVLFLMSGFLKREFFAVGTVVVRQGDPGDKFYIIRGGNVQVTKRDGEVERKVGVLKRGDYFGEQALLHADRRLATVTALPPGVECLTIERQPFNKYLGNLEELKKIVHVTPDPIPKPDQNKPKSGEFEYVQLKDLEIIGTLGVGGFGRVELVHYRPNKKLTFALKCLKKVDMVQQQQQQHAYNEKEIMMLCNSPFICKLYRTYKDNKYIYLLMEPVLGGDLWTVLQKRGHFDEPTAKFMSACVVEAFQYLHSKNVVYRDLKPENLMLDKYGYVKLVDFGFAKLISPNSKTWTFAGTPEYVAPEIICNKGHDRAVDCWALGIFIHELIVGRPPFRAPGGDHMTTYMMINNGIDAIKFHARVRSDAQSLIRKLCRSVPVERLGYLKNGMNDVKKHRWYNGFDWKKLQERKLKAPLIQPVDNDWDLSNFEKYPKDKLPPDETSGWDIDF